MKTYEKCIDCFLRQANDASVLLGLPEDISEKIYSGVKMILPQGEVSSTPPEIARDVYSVVGGFSEGVDIYKNIKLKSNKKALSLYPDLKNTINGSEDPLLTAARLAVAGNVIDYGLPHIFDIEDEIRMCMDKPFAFFDHESFKSDIASAKTVLYILDNAGEIVFDRLLIECMGKDVVAAVRDVPIINDVTLEDSRQIGLEDVCRVISSGSDMPGTVISQTTAEFKDIFINADVVISKGQGNYETLSPAERSVYFLFKAKCDVVAGHVGCALGDFILKKDPVLNV